MSWPARASFIRSRTLAGVAVAAALAAVLSSACSLGEGTGSVGGVLDAPFCWSGCFDLKPDFFAAVPSSAAALQIRIQRGGDFETFSDGLAIQVDDVGRIRGDPLPGGTTRPSLLGQPLAVGLPPAVTPPGVPIMAVANPPLVHATLYLDQSCRTQNVALYAMDTVTLNADGSCGRPDGGDTPLSCPSSPTTSADGGPASEAGPTSDAGATTVAGADGGSAPASTTGPGTTGASSCEPSRSGTGPASSTIVFDNLFDDNPDESNAQQRLTQGHFDFFLADPREICPGGLGPPPRCRGHLAGDFKFYFQRGRPAQPFP